MMHLDADSGVTAADYTLTHRRKEAHTKWSVPTPPPPLLSACRSQKALYMVLYCTTKSFTVEVEKVEGIQ